MTSPTQHVVLLGDSTLDNIIWLSSYDECVKAKLIKNVGTHVFVSNYAADGFTTTNMLEGGYPALSHAQRLHVDPYPCELTNFKPLEHLKDLHKRQPVTDIVLSVGGNDIRVALRSIEKIESAVQQFSINYKLILGACLEITPKVTIMMQYRPALSQDHVYGIYHALSSGSGRNSSIENMNRLMERMYPPVLQLANKHQLPLIDLPNSFDPRFSDLFCAQIEPSAYGSSLTSCLISHTLHAHKWAQSSFYSCYPTNYKKIEGTTDVEVCTIESVPNNGNDWKIRLLPTLEEHVTRNWSQSTITY